MNLACLLLAALPVVEPDSGSLPRIQPRDVKGEAAAVLWAVDDDPATAWKAPLKDATLEWWGASREGSMLKVFFRSAGDGCARPRHVAFSTLPSYARDTDPPPTVLVLADTPDWQALLVRLTPNLGPGFQLKIADAHGANDAVCINDLRVYFVGKEKVDAAEEQLAAEHLRRLVADRLHPDRAAVQRVPADVAVTRPIARPDAALAFAGEAAPLQDVPPEWLEANGWKRASVRSVLDDDASVDAPLAGTEPVSELADALLASDDFKLVAAPSPARALKTLTQQLPKLSSRPLECQRVCLPSYAAVSTRATAARAGCERACRFFAAAGAADIRRELAGSGIFVKGDLERPREVLVLGVHDTGERELRRESHRELFVYENGRVAAVVSRGVAGLEVQLLTWSPDRSRVSSIARVTLDLQTVLNGRTP